MAIPSKKQKPNGLHQRYIVKKINGSAPDLNAEYFVLRLDSGCKDPAHLLACRKAVTTYAKSIFGHLQELSNDLMDRYASVKTLHPFDRLEEWSHKYDFNVQMMDGDYNIFISRDGVELHSIGGERNLSDAVEIVMQWILRVNGFKS